MEQNLDMFLHALRSCWLTSRNIILTQKSRNSQKALATLVLTIRGVLEATTLTLMSFCSFVKEKETCSSVLLSKERKTCSYVLLSKKDPFFCSYVKEKEPRSSVKEKKPVLLSKRQIKRNPNESQTKSKASEQEYSKLIHGHCAPCGGRQ